MATVSLIDTGVQLGRTSGQQVKLGSLRDAGYSRTKAVSGYLRVNPFEVQGGNADDPDRADNLHYLGNWFGYDHDRLPAGSNLEDAGGYDAVDIAWSAPSGASRAPEITGAVVYIKDTGLPTGSSPGETQTSTDPTSSPDKTVEVGFGASVVEALNTSAGFASGNWVAVAVVTRFKDSVSTHEDSEGASAKAGETPLTGAFEGILAQVFSATPTITNVDQNPQPGSCFVGENVDIIIDVSMDGPSEGTLQRETNGSGTWVTVSTNVTPGASQITDPNRASGNTYNYRLRYNAVSPTQWSNEASHFADCTLV